MKNLDLSNAQNMDLGVISNFSYSNASGEHPPEFNLDYYNTLISLPLPIEQIDNLIKKVNDSATEYQRQSTEHASNQDYENSAITDSWRDTALRVKDELIQKRNSLASQDTISVIPQRNLGELGEANVAPISLGQSVSDNAVPQDIQPIKKAPLPSDSGKPSPPDYARPTGDDDVFVADKTSNDGKILGMPKAVAIGLGIAVVSIGGFLVYKKFIAKK